MPLLLFHLSSPSLLFCVLCVGCECFLKSIREGHLSPLPSRLICLWQEFTKSLYRCLWISGCVSRCLWIAVASCHKSAFREISILVRWLVHPKSCLPLLSLLCLWKLILLKCVKFGDQFLYSHDLCHWINSYSERRIYMLVTWVLKGKLLVIIYFDLELFMASKAIILASLWN